MMVAPHSDREPRRGVHTRSGRSAVGLSVVGLLLMVVGWAGVDVTLGDLHLLVFAALLAALVSGGLAVVARAQHERSQWLLMPMLLGLFALAAVIFEIVVLIIPGGE